MAEGKAMSEFLPFSRPAMGVEELAAVKEVLESGWITTGPRTKKLEKELGKDIDEGKFSAPGRELAPDIAGRGLTAALR